MQTMLVYPKEKTLFTILMVMASLFWFLIIIGTLGMALMYVLMFFIMYLFAQSAFISYVKGTAVRITPQQFPELHSRIIACAEKVGLRHDIPEAYLLRSDGIFNAFATKFLGRNYIALYAELVDALQERPDALNFYIGHELGHLHRKHLTLGPILAPVAWLPLIGPAYSRAREYTSDRYGLLCCANPADAAHAVAVLAAGGQHAQVMDQAVYADQRKATSGFWMSFHELVGDYPWLVKRLHAVRELGEGREPRMPDRHPMAWLFAFLVPRSGGQSGGAGIIMMAAIIGILAATAIPKFAEYQTKGKAKAFEADGRNLMTHLGKQATTLEEAKEAIEALKHNDTNHTVTLAATTMTVQDGGTIELLTNDTALDSATLTLNPEVSETEEVSWHCELTTPGKLKKEQLTWCK